MIVLCVKCVTLGFFELLLEIYFTELINRVSCIYELFCARYIIEMDSVVHRVWAFPNNEIVGEVCSFEVSGISIFLFVYSFL